MIALRHTDYEICQRAARKFVNDIDKERIDYDSFAVDLKGKHTPIYKKDFKKSKIINYMECYVEKQQYKIVYYCCIYIIGEKDTLNLKYAKFYCNTRLEQI